MNKKISIVTPTFNEENNIEALCFAVSEEMKKLSYDYEHIIIDNSSDDKTVEILKKLIQKDKKIKVIVNEKNYGHIRSPVHAIFQASGDAVILMMADFQDPISLIKDYIKEWENGCEVVMAQKNTSEENFFKHFLKGQLYKFINKLSEQKQLINTTGSGLYSKRIVQELKSFKDPYPYFRGLITEVTDKIKLINFHQPKRKSGVSKNNFYTLYDIGILAIIKHSKLPLRVITLIGFFLSIISMIVALVFFFRKILNWSSFDLGIAPIIIGLFTLGSIQILILGLIGEYVMYILTHTRKLPLVIEKERINF